MAVLSAADPTIAPDGGDMLYLNSNVPRRPDGGWEAAKDAYTEQIWKSALRFLGGIECEIGRIATTLLDFEDRFAAPAGAFLHVDMLVNRLGPGPPGTGIRQV